jgi:hypothetical protein
MSADEKQFDQEQDTTPIVDSTNWIGRHMEFINWH